MEAGSGFFWPGFAAFGFGVGSRHGRRARRFKRGILKFVLLKLLAEEPRHGYDLIRAFRHKGWSGGAGSIYPLLAALEEEGLIAGRDEGERRTYEVTEKGQRHLHEQGHDWSTLFEDDDDEDEDASKSSVRDELRDAVGRLVSAVSQLGESSAPETITHVRELLDRTRKDIYTLLAQE
jgi:DNA-binding PadR family transcriptional regulator